MHLTKAKLSIAIWKYSNGKDNAKQIKCLIFIAGPIRIRFSPRNSPQLLHSATNSYQTSKFEIPDKHCNKLLDISIIINTFNNFFYTL